MHIAFSGCRDYRPKLKEVIAAYKAIHQALRVRVVAEGPDSAVLVGDCPTGVDAEIRKRYIYCLMSANDPKVFEADWNKHGKAAGPIRNKEMVSESDGLIAFWDGKSRGTKNAIDCAVADEKIVIIMPTT